MYIHATATFCASLIITNKQQDRKAYKLRLREHVWNRGLERFNVFLTRAEQRSIKRQVDCGRARLIGKGHGHARKVYEVFRYGKKFPVVYDHSLGVVVTVLPEDVVSVSIL